MINKKMYFFRDSTMVGDDVDFSIVDVQDIFNNKNDIYFIDFNSGQGQIYC